MSFDGDEELHKKWTEFCKYAQDTLASKESQGSSSGEEKSLFLKFMQQQRSEIYEECGFGEKVSEKLDELIKKTEQFCLLNIVNLYDTFNQRAQVKNMASCTVDLKRIDDIVQTPVKATRAKKTAKRSISSAAENTPSTDTDLEKDLENPNNQELGRGKRKKIAKTKFEFSEDSPFSYKAKETVVKKTPQNVPSKKKIVSRSEPPKRKNAPKTDGVTKTPSRAQSNVKRKKIGLKSPPVTPSSQRKTQLISTKATKTGSENSTAQIDPLEPTKADSPVKTSVNRDDSIVDLDMCVSAEEEPSHEQAGETKSGETAAAVDGIKVEGQDETESPENHSKEDQDLPGQDKADESQKDEEEEKKTLNDAPQQGDKTAENEIAKRGKKKQTLPWNKVPVVCSLCKTQFAAYSTLRRHWARVHTEDRKFNSTDPPKLLLCTVCDEQFSLPHVFLKHYRAHSAQDASGQKHSGPESTVSSLKQEEGMKSSEENGMTAVEEHQENTVKNEDHEAEGLTKSGAQNNGDLQGEINETSIKEDEENGAGAMQEKTENETEGATNGLVRKVPVSKRLKKGRGPQKTPKKFPWSLVPIVCSMCKTRYSTYSTLRRHWTKMHSENKEFDRLNPPKLMLCTVCDETFSWPRQYLKHYREHAEGHELSQDRFKPVKFVGERTDFPSDKLAPITCSLCKKVMIGEGVIYGHWKKEHKTEEQTKPPPLFYCDKCGQTFDAPRKFKLHYRIHTGAKPHACEACDKTFRTFSDLNAHMLCHNQSKEFKCTICGKEFLAQKILNRHMKGHLFPCICNVCGKSYPSKYSLNLHMKIHTGEKPHKCDFCGVAFIQAGSLKLHRRLHLGDKPHVCETCGMRFNSLSHLRTHKRVHTGEKPYKCDKCDYAAASSSRLKDHATVHKDEKPHVCKVPGCGRRYKRLSHLIFHHSKHAGVKPYVCKTCGMAFKLSSALSLHRRQDACALRKEEVKDEWVEEQPKEEAITNYSLLVSTSDEAMGKDEEIKEEHQTVYIYHDVKDDLQAVDDGIPQIVEFQATSEAELAVEDPEGYEQQIVIQIVREPGQEDEDIVLSKEELERIVHLSQQM